MITGKFPLFHPTVLSEKETKNIALIIQQTTIKLFVGFFQFGINLPTVSKILKINNIVLIVSPLSSPLKFIIKHYNTELGLIADNAGKTTKVKT